MVVIDMDMVCVALLLRTSRSNQAFCGSFGLQWLDGRREKGVWGLSKLDLVSMLS